MLVSSTEQAEPSAEQPELPTKPPAACTTNTPNPEGGRKRKGSQNAEESQKPEGSQNLQGSQNLACQRGRTEHPIKTPVSSTEQSTSPTEQSISPAEQSISPTEQAEPSAEQPELLTKPPAACITNTPKHCKWDDVGIMFEIKSSNTVNSSGVLSNLILKATEALRFQCFRLFIPAFLICGTSLRIVRCERGGVFVGTPVEFDKDAEILVKCLIAGFVMDKGTDVRHLIDDRTIETVDVDGRPHVVVQVDDQKFILGEQIDGPAKDHLASHGTAVFRAKKKGENTGWIYCFKSASPYARRRHEGSILEELQGTPGMVRMFAYSTPSTSGMWSLTPEDITKKFQQRTSGRGTPSEKPPPSDYSGQGAGRQFHPREIRWIVTEYIADSFKSILGITDFLQAWQSLYHVINSIASKGWVHRDLSWTNVRLRPFESGWEAIIIDFDLASAITGTASGSPDKTGTPAFMSIRILLSINGQHQELHEDEAAFWVGFLAILQRVKSGREQLETIFDPKISLEQLGNIKSSLAPALLSNQK
ncbi:hypothetical protein GP486_006577 [Trichoglossum hirsutum]|uniref:Fungal-type protein kinase domain-containing protein n=1 Tax=Trichoglossum hirsutum TaxID=265104 RepID=A0A9P8IDG0_9PEZI|nr:hypothetical protein GP486_006577 [Trichoglossum hirsutum]